MTQKKINLILLHFMVWIILFSAPYLFAYDNPDFISKMIQQTWVVLFFYALVFYTNYFVLIPRYFFKKKNVIFIALNGIIIVFLAMLMFEVKRLFHPVIPHFEGKPFLKPPSGNLFIYKESLSLIIPIIFSMVVKISERWKKDEVERKEVEKIKLASELKYLKHQLQPHFFFNTINNIYSLIEIAPNDAKKSLHKLSKLMRYLLYNTSEKTVPLKNELTFLENYIELMKLRVSDNVTISVDFSEFDESIKIPPLLFISMVENSFKHGIDAIKPSFIKILLKVENNKIHFNCINSYFPSSTSTNEKGIGNYNSEKRLQLLFENNYTLVSEKRESEYYVELVINTDYE